MSLHEIGLRGRQELSKLRERRLSAATFKMTDAALLSEFAPAARNGTGAGTAEMIIERRRAISAKTERHTGRRHWFPSLSERSEITEIMASRFPDDLSRIIERAERALDGRFDLLGHKDLYFGNPVDWHLEPISGKRAPLVHWSRLDYLNPLDGGDQKVLWELNRHSHFVTFAQAYWLTGDERFVEEFVRQSTQWMESNPPAMGVNWAGSLEVAFRSIAWLWALHLCAGSKCLTRTFVTRLVECLIAHGRHIESYLSHYYSPNTHLTGEALGLFYLGTALPELRRAARWRETGLSILVDQLPVQVRQDGVYFEQASYYHRYTADFYAHLIILLQAGGNSLPDAALERVGRLFDHLMWITRPDGTSPIYGDDDGGRLLKLSDGMANDFRHTLATGAVLFGRNDWKFVAGESGVEILWLLGSEGLEKYDRLQARPPQEIARAFSESGYYVIRSGWSSDSDFMLIDCGPHGGLSSCGHAHSDALAIDFAASGRTWLVDPGTFVYDADIETRDRFRSTSAHNTVTVDGRSQSTPAGPFAWREIASCELNEFRIEPHCAYFSGSHDGYRRLDDPVTHTRSVLMVKDSGVQTWVLVRDRFEAGSMHRYSINYHFAPGCQAEADKDRITANDAEGGILTIAAMGPANLVTKIRQGGVSTCYGNQVEAPIAVFEAEAEGPQDFVTLIIPGQKERMSCIRRVVSEHYHRGNLDQFIREIVAGCRVITGEQGSESS